MTDDGFQGAGSLHCIFHSVHEWQVLHCIPQSLVCLHEDIHETVGRIEDVLEFAVGVRGLVGVSGDRIAFLQYHERHDFGLKIVPCCSMADGWMDVKNSNGSKWEVCARYMAAVEFEE